VKGNIANLKPFKKGQSGNPKGGPKKTTSWKEAEDLLRDAIPRLIKMDKNELAELLKSNPTGAEMLAAKYIHEHAVEAVNRFLGKTPETIKSEVTGKDGAPLLAGGVPVIDFSKFSPDKIRALIEATK
jgi:hypothetical protein